MFVYIIWASFGDYSHEIDDWGQYILRRLANIWMGGKFIFVDLDIGTVFFKK